MAVQSFGVTTAFLERRIAGLDLTNFEPTPAAAIEVIDECCGVVHGLIEGKGLDPDSLSATGALYLMCRRLVVLLCVADLCSARWDDEHAEAHQRKVDAEIARLKLHPGDMGDERPTGYTGAGIPLTHVSRADDWATDREDITATPATRMRSMLERGVR